MKQKIVAIWIEPISSGDLMTEEHKNACTNTVLEVNKYIKNVLKWDYYMIIDAANPVLALWKKDKTKEIHYFAETQFYGYHKPTRKDYIIAYRYEYSAIGHAVSISPTIYPWNKNIANTFNKNQAIKNGIIPLLPAEMSEYEIGFSMGGEEYHERLLKKKFGKKVKRSEWNKDDSDLVKIHLKTAV